MGIQRRWWDDPGVCSGVLFVGSGHLRKEPECIWTGTTGACGRCVGRFLFWFCKCSVSSATFCELLHLLPKSTLLSFIYYHSRISHDAEE